MCYNEVRRVRDGIATTNEQMYDPILEKSASLIKRNANEASEARRNQMTNHVGMKDIKIALANYVWWNCAATSPGELGDALEITLELASGN